MQIRAVSSQDVTAIVRLYNTYVRETLVTFETVPVDAAELSARIARTIAHHDWLVAEEDGAFLGYAYYGAFRAREAYRGTVESSVYLHDGAKGRGVGTALYQALCESAREKGYREMIGVITVPNAHSEALHRCLGFEPVGVLRRVGRKFDQDADVALWQLCL